MSSSLVAFRYLELAEKRMKRTAPTPGSITSQSSSCKECDTTVQGKSQKKPPKSSEELLKYVLESAPEGSLKDLSRVVKPTKDTDAIGEGGFSVVYQCSIEGKDIAVKQLRLSEESETFVIRVSCCRKGAQWLIYVHAEFCEGIARFSSPQTSERLYISWVRVGGG